LLVTQPELFQNPISTAYESQLLETAYFCVG
jgi:hypothetical protein